MLELKNISWEIPDGDKILKGIDLEIPDGKMTVITGPNGGGKTSLAKIIAGLEVPNSGEILLDGENITDWDITKRAKNGIAYAFQQPVRFKGITVRDLLWSFTSLIDAFQKLKNESGKSLLVISHQERILEIADYIVVIADGNVRAFGEGKDVLPQLLKEEKESKCPLGKDKKGENN